MSERDERTARERFTVGQRVKATRDAFVNGAVDTPEVYGTVVGFARSNPYEVGIVLEGRKTRHNWHVTFWSPAPTHDSTEPATPEDSA